MTILYLRQASVKIGPAGGTGREIRNLRISFEIRKNLENNPNTAKISIYNLSEDTRSLFEKPNSFVILSVGWGKDPNDLKQIFTGDVARVNTIKNNTDWITTIESGDGEKALFDSTLDKSFGKGTDAKEVIKSLGKSLLNVKNVDQAIEKTFQATDKFANGYAVTGKVKQELDKALTSFGYEWSIQNNEFQLVKKNKSTSNTVYKLNASSGLIGSPSKTDKGIKVTSLLLPDINPGRAVILDSINIKGVYYVRELVHTGDTFQDKWVTEMECVTE